MTKIKFMNPKKMITTMERLEQRKKGHECRAGVGQRRWVALLDGGGGRGDKICLIEMVVIGVYSIYCLTVIICVKVLRWDHAWGIQGTAKRSIWFKVIKVKSGNERNGWEAGEVDLTTMKVLVLSDSATTWTLAHQASQSMEFSRQKYRSG